ncbi:ubiquitin-related domain-containing protein [Phyllosticta capitalensis]|uniref:Ubiquitin-related domain-containing protein n=2 Tax=Phyllosticta capitalensis TaxID=121624 RepID=A0ABR1YX36_9PEZI
MAAAPPALDRASSSSSADALPPPSLPQHAHAADSDHILSKETSTSVEMTNLAPTSQHHSGPDPDPSISPTPPPHPPPADQPEDTAQPESSSSAAAPALGVVRSETEAIGPASDTPAAKPDTTAGPVVVITLLLTSGARHPYKIDEKYLRKRNVTPENMDPFNISVYTLKELIWRDWREEWEPRPTSPSSIRLISFGRMLDDKQHLKDCRFQTESPNVVHMTVKPQEAVDDEDAKTAKAGGRTDDDGEPTARCRCAIL